MAMMALVDIGMIGQTTSSQQFLKSAAEIPMHVAIPSLLRDKKDFLLACEIAGVEPFLVRT